MHWFCAYRLHYLFDRCPQTKSRQHRCGFLIGTVAHLAHYCLKGSKLVVTDRSCCLMSSVLVKPSEVSQRQSRLQSLQYWQTGRCPVDFDFFLVRTVLAVSASSKTLSLIPYMRPSQSLPPVRVSLLPALLPGSRSIALVSRILGGDGDAALPTARPACVPLKDILGNVRLR
jgi:hypothetical protein